MDLVEARDTLSALRRYASTPEGLCLSSQRIALDVGEHLLSEIDRLRGESLACQAAFAEISRSADELQDSHDKSIAIVLAANASLHAEVEQRKADYAELDKEFGELLDCFDEDGNPVGDEDESVPDDGYDPDFVDLDTLRGNIQAAVNQVCLAPDSHVRLQAINQLSWLDGWVAGQQEERE